MVRAKKLWRAWGLWKVWIGDLVPTSVIRTTSKTLASIGSDALILPWINFLLALLVHWNGSRKRNPHLCSNRSKWIDKMGLLEGDHFLTYRDLLPGRNFPKFCVLRSCGDSENRLLVSGPLNQELRHPHSWDRGWPKVNQGFSTRQYPHNDVRIPKGSMYSVHVWFLISRSLPRPAKSSN